MAEGMDRHRLEQVRRSLAMSPTLPRSVADEMLAEVHRLRGELVALVDEVDAVVMALRRIQRSAEDAAR